MKLQWIFCGISRGGILPREDWAIRPEEFRSVSNQGTCYLREYLWVGSRSVWFCVLDSSEISSNSGCGSYLHMTSPRAVTSRRKYHKCYIGWSKAGFALKKINKNQVALACQGQEIGWTMVLMGIRSTTNHQAAISVYDGPSSTC